jgi:leucyl/phenylalanyl-tRNA---protein transferase
MSYVEEDGVQHLTRSDLVRLGPEGERVSPFLILYHYGYGVFSWLAQEGKPLWWSPEPRAILIPDEFRVNRSFRKTLKRAAFTVTSDTAFAEVLRLCVETRPTTWITSELQDSFLELHKLGHAHSVEVWDRGTLVGGLFGVCVGKMFYGASMFHLSPNASKFAFLKLAETLSRLEFQVIDCQILNPYLKKMGARTVPRVEFHDIVRQATQKKPILGMWTEFFK